MNKMSAISIYKCIHCRQIYNIYEVRYVCECGNLLEVVHDLKSVIPDPEKWKNKIDKELNRIAFERYQDLLLPILPNNKME